MGALTEEAACQITLGSAAVGGIDDAITEVIAIDVYFQTEGGRIAQTPARILCAIVDLHRDGSGYDLIIGDEHIAEYNLLTFMQDPDAWTSIREAGNNDDDEDLLGDVDAFAAINYPSVDTEEKFNAQLEKAANEKLFPAELPQEQRQRAIEVLRKYNRAMGGGVPFKAGQATLLPYQAEVTEEYKGQARRRIPEGLQAAVKATINTMIEEYDFAKEVQNAIHSPVHIIDESAKKGPGGVRVTIDYREVNKVTIPTTQSNIPPITQIMAKLGHYKFFVTLDATKGYWQRPIEKSTARRLAFSTPWGVYEPNGCPMGERNQAGSFQHARTQLYKDVPWMHIYIDNDAFGADTYEELMDKLGKVLERAQDNRFVYNWKDLRIGYQELELLGYVVSREGYKPHHKHRQKLQTLEAPKTRSELRSQLQVANQLRAHISDYAGKVGHLSAKTGGNGPLEWNEDDRKQWLTLRQALEETETLTAYDSEIPLLVGADASTTKSGMVPIRLDHSSHHQQHGAGSHWHDSKHARAQPSLCRQDGFIC